MAILAASSSQIFAKHWLELKKIIKREKTKNLNFNIKSQPLLFLYIRVVSKKNIENLVNIEKIIK